MIPSLWFGLVFGLEIRLGLEDMHSFSYIQITITPSEGLNRVRRIVLKYRTEIERNKQAFTIDTVTNKSSINVTGNFAQLV
mmetsp:Transcript_40761/g.85116  ORF Transcript_40761/g.85116 Transcript_40761/m.85116 type:complete len:81 (+) Transcript_40761:51-293(+)